MIAAGRCRVSCGGLRDQRPTEAPELDNAKAAGSADRGTQMPINGSIMQGLRPELRARRAGFFVDLNAHDTTRSYTRASCARQRRSPTSSVPTISSKHRNGKHADNASRAVNGLLRHNPWKRSLLRIRPRARATSRTSATSATPTSPGYARVFKCDHTEPDGVDRNLLDGYSGHSPRARSDDGR